MNEITDLLTKLDRLDPKYKSKIKSFEGLKNALQDLGNMIEMKEAKGAIILQLKYILMKIFNANEEVRLEEIFDDHMLHTVIYGPPGVGKTQLGKILSQFYSSLGILKEPTPQLHEEYKIHQLLQTAHENYTRMANLTSIRLIMNRDLLHQVQKDLSIYRIPEIHEKLDRYDRELHEIIDMNIYMANPPVSQEKELFRVVSRPDFVAGYSGQTALKTTKLLNECVGKVLFIDEAYTLIHDDKDSFGMEALTVLNLFMSNRPYDCVIIFGGYKDLLEKTIFKYQPGLRRRCSWIFEIQSYTPSGLSQIFQNQLQKYGWKVHESVALENFFRDHRDDFSAFGGDTHKLAFYCKLHHHEEEFVALSETKKRKRNPGPNVILESTLKKALKSLRENRVQEKKEKIPDPPAGLYT